MENTVTIESSGSVRDKRAQIANYATHSEVPRMRPDSAPEEIKEHATRLLDLGFNIVAVAHRLGVQPKRLRAIMKDEPLSPAVERRTRVAALVSEGHDFDDIVEALGVEPQSVREDLKALRIKISTVSRKSRRMEKRKGDLKRLHDLGMSPSEMTRELGLTIGQVRYTLDVLGLKWRNRA